MQQGWLVFVYMIYGALQSRTDSRGRNHLEAMSLTCLVVVLVVRFNLPKCPGLLHNTVALNFLNWGPELQR